MENKYKNEKYQQTLQGDDDSRVVVLRLEEVVQAIVLQHEPPLLPLVRR